MKSFKNYKLSGALVAVVLAVFLFSAPVAALAIGPENPGSGSEKIAVNVGFESGINRGLVERHGGEITKELTQINVVAAEVPEQAVEALSQNPQVEFVEKDGKMYALQQTTPWGIDRIDADVVIDDGDITAGDSQIAIVDTGIDPNHEDLSVAGGKSFVDYTNDWYDDAGHGTHVAGIAAALNNEVGVVGVAPEVSLYAAKVLDGDGAGSYSDVADGITWAAEQGHDVISMSLGGDHSDTVKKAVEFAYDSGSLLVASAGNDGKWGRFSTVNYPAAYAEVIAVSATDQDDDIARFSSRGSEVELAAPGVDIKSTYLGGGYETMSGTSMSAPHVSGAAAYLMANGMSNTQAREQLKSTAEDLGLDSTEQGAGLVDVAAAVESVEETGALEGTVTDTSGNPIEGVTVEIVDTGDTAETDVDGYYLIEGVSTGEYDVTASKDGYYSEIKPVTIEKDVTKELNFSLEEIPTYTVSGTVTSNEGNAIEGATVDIENTSLSATTDVDGNYTIEDVEKGTYDITASADGYQENTKTVTVDTNVTVDFSLEETADVAPVIDRFELTDTSNPAWARVEVKWTVSDGDGNLDKVELVLEQDGGEKDSKTISVSGSEASGEDQLQEKKSSGTYDVTITVTDTQGNEATETKEINLG